MKRINILAGIAIIALAGCLMFACSSGTTEEGGVDTSTTVNGFQGGKQNGVTDGVINVALPSDLSLASSGLIISGYPSGTTGVETLQWSAVNLGAWAYVDVTSSPSGKVYVSFDSNNPNRTTDRTNLNANGTGSGTITITYRTQLVNPDEVIITLRGAGKSVSSVITLVDVIPKGSTLAAPSLAGPYYDTDVFPGTVVAGGAVDGGTLDSRPFAGLTATLTLAGGLGTFSVPLTSTTITWLNAATFNSDGTLASSTNGNPTFAPAGAKGPFWISIVDEDGDKIVAPTTAAGITYTTIADSITDTALKVVTQPAPYKLAFEPDGGTPSDVTDDPTDLLSSLGTSPVIRVQWANPRYVETIPYTTFNTGASPGGGLKGYVGTAGTAFTPAYAAGTARTFNQKLTYSYPDDETLGSATTIAANTLAVKVVPPKTFYVTQRNPLYVGVAGTAVTASTVTSAVTSAISGGSIWVTAIYEAEGLPDSGQEIDIASKITVANITQPSGTGTTYWTNDDITDPDTKDVIAVLMFPARNSTLKDKVRLVIQGY